MAILDNLTNRNKSILERRYIDQVLEEEGKKLITSQNRLDLKFGFTTNKFRQGRSARVSGNTLTYQHNIIQRFVDMRRLNGIAKTRLTPIHNKIIFSHYNNIINNLRYGFVEAVKEQLHAQLKIEIDG